MNRRRACLGLALLLATAAWPFPFLRSAAQEPAPRHVRFAIQAEDAAGLIRSVTDLAVEEEGTVYVLDGAAGRVQRFEPSGEVTALWGTTGARQGHFSDPSALALAPDGDVFVADTGNRRVQRFDARGAYVGAWGAGEPAGGIPVLPVGIGVDTHGVVWVSDAADGSLQRFSGDGQWLSQVQSPPVRAGHPFSPTQIAAATDGAMWVVDRGKDLIHRFEPDGTWSQSLASEPSVQERLDWRFNDVAVGADGTIYGERSEGIQHFTAEGGHGGRFDTFDRRAGAISARGSDRLVVGFARRTRYDVATRSTVLDPLTVGEILVGHERPPYRILGVGRRIGRRASFEAPAQFGVLGGHSGRLSMAVTADGDLFVAHFRADRVQRFRSDGLYLEELRGLTGSDSGLAAMGIGADPDGSLWIASLARRGLLHLDRDLRELGVITPTRLSPSAVTGIAVAPDGTLVLAESVNGGIERLSRDGRSLLAWGGQRSRWNPEDYGYCRNYDVIGVSCAAQPVAVARDGRTIFLLDGSEGRVLRYTMDGERLEPWTGLAQESEVRRTAQALTVAPDGSLYVADTGAGEVVRFSTGGEAIERLGGPEDAQAPFDRPVALAAGADGMLYVADIPAGRVLALGADAVDAWRGEFFAGPWPIERARAIEDFPELDLRWDEETPDPALDPGGWSARFTRELSLTPGAHRFGLTAEGGVRLWLGDRLAVDAWHAPRAQWIVQAEAPPDGVLEVRVEYRSGRDTAALSLVVDDPSLPTVTAIPTRVPTAGPTSTPTATTTPSGQPSGRIHLPVLQAR